MEEGYLLHRIAQVLHNEKKDSIPSLRFEMAYNTRFNRDLNTDLKQLNKSIYSIFESGVSRGSKPLDKNGIRYKLIRNAGNNMYMILRERDMNHQPRFEFEEAKASDIYELCNDILEEQTFDHIPLDLLEKIVSERLLSYGLVLSQDQKGQNFHNLLGRTYGNYTRGVIKDGKLYKVNFIPTTTYPSGENLPVFPMFDPTAVSQQSPAIPANHIQTATSSISSMNLNESYSYQNTIGKNLIIKLDQLRRFDFSKHKLPSTLQNLVKRTDYTKNTFQEFCDTNKDLVEKLINSYFKNGSTFWGGNDQELRAQRAAMYECEFLWSKKVKNLSSFLYILKCFWLNKRSMSCLEISGTFLDPIIDSTGNYFLNWASFGDMDEGDLMLWKLFIPKRNPQIGEENHIELHPCIQMVNFYRFFPNQLGQRLYYFLEFEKSEEYSASFDEISNSLQIDKQSIVIEANKHVPIFSVQHSIEKIKLKTPLPFLVPE